jgi:hypothetical protein
MNMSKLVAEMVNEAERRMLEVEKCLMGIEKELQEGLEVKGLTYDEAQGIGRLSLSILRSSNAVNIARLGLPLAEAVEAMNIGAPQKQCAEFFKTLAVA